MYDDTIRGRAPGDWIRCGAESEKCQVSLTFTCDLTRRAFISVSLFSQGIVALRLSFWAHEFVAAFARLSDQHLAFGRDHLFRLT
jgi:hypothetical protein